MKIEEAYNHLLTTVDGTARSLLGMWSDASLSGHNGLAAFFTYEHGERTKDLMNIAYHMAGQKHKAVFKALDQPQAKFENCAVAVKGLWGWYGDIVKVASMVKASMIENGENPYFVKDYICKMEREMKEVEGVLEMVSVSGKEELEAANKRLMKKYA